MSKFYIFVLSLYLAFAPAYAHTISFKGLGKGVAKAANTKAGQILVKNGGKFAKITPYGRALSLAAQAVVEGCSAYQSFTGDTCLDALQRALEDDGWKIETGNGEIEIYKEYGDCEYQFRSNSAYYSNPTKSSHAQVCKDYIGTVVANESYIYTSVPTTSKGKLYCKYQTHALPSNKLAPGINGWGYSEVVKHCSSGTPNKTYITHEQMYQYITNNLSDNDLINIYNYDYSQHSNIKINGDTYTGYKINNDLSIENNYRISDDGTPGSVLEISPEFAPKIITLVKPNINVKPNIDIGLPDINYNNCTANGDGVIINCDKLLKDKDKDKNDNKDDDDNKVPDPSEPDEPEKPKEMPPIECNANGFYKKICDWMDWTQDKHTPPHDTQPTIVDKSKELDINDSRIRFNNQCPTPKPINITLMGIVFSDELDYQPMCDFFTALKPFVVGTAGVTGALIIAGGVRRG